MKMGPKLNEDELIKSPTTSRTGSTSPSQGNCSQRPVLLCSVEHSPQYIQLRSEAYQMPHPRKPQSPSTQVPSAAAMGWGEQEPCQGGLRDTCLLWLESCPPLTHTHICIPTLLMDTPTLAA